ncbi:unnamed protein product, partial [Closterium sp. NIES-54]
LAYSELCVELPDGVFRLCLLRTLGVLFDLFASHHHMMTWRHPYVKRPNTMSMDRFPRMAAPDPVCASAPVSASSSASDLPQLARVPTPPHGLPRSSSVSAAAGGSVAGSAAAGGAANGAGSGAGEANGAAAFESAAGGEGRAPGESREGLHARRRSQSLVIEIPGSGEQLQEKAEEGDSERDNGAEPGKGQDGQRNSGSEGASGSDGQRSGVQRTEAQRSNSERTDAQAQQQTGHAQLQQQRRQVRRSSSEGHNEAWGSAGAAAGAEALVRDGRPPIPSAGHSGTEAAGGGGGGGAEGGGLGEGIAAAAVAAAAAAAAGVGGGDDRSRNRGGGGGADMALRTDDVMMMGSDFREGSLADLPPNVARKMRVSTSAAVCRALQKNRKAVWELAARRVGALLTAPALCSGSSQQFLQCLEWVDKFAAVGEAFTGVEAAGLRTKMVKQSEVYFNTFHRQNLKVLKMILERETWQRLPPETVHTLRLISLTTSSAPSSSASSSFVLSTQSSSSSVGSRESGGVEGGGSGGEGAKERRDFREWLERGNPFAAVEAGEEEAAEGREGGERAEGGERSSSGSGGGGTGGREGGAGAGSGDSAVSASGAAAGTRERGDGSSRGQAGNPQGRILPGGRAESDRGSQGDRSQAQARGGGVRSRLSTGGDGVGEGEEDEDEREELMADYIDEEEVGVSAAVLAGRGRRRSEDGGGDVGGRGGLDTSLALTGAALTVIRLMDRYTRLMGLLPPIASGIFAGLCQLFDLYLVTVFRLFGSPDAVGTLRSSDPAAAALLTPKLRTTLARVAQGLDDARNKPISSLSPTGTPSATGAAAAAALGEAAAAAAAAAVEAVGGVIGGGSSSGSLAGSGSNNVLVSSSNMFGLKERCVAMESLMWLTDMLRQTKPRFQSLLAPPAWTAMDIFYARTLDAVPDLWEHVLRTLVKLLLNIVGTADRIAAVNWEPAEIGTQHNIYVENLVAEFRLFAHRLGQSGAPRQVQDQLVAYGLDELCDVMLDGICRVKKCNSNGRALMSLDLQVLVQGLQPIVGRGAVKGLQLVDNYIKAFYLSESQIIDWVRAHPEYTKAQVIALVVMAANGGNWKLKNKFEIIKKIDTGGSESGATTGIVPRNTGSRLGAAAFHDGVTDDCDVVAAAFRDRVTDDGGDAAHPSTADHNHHYPGRERLDDLQPPLIYRRGQAHPVADRSQPFDGGIDDAPLNHALVNDGADAVGVKGSPRDDAAASPDRTLMRSAPPCSGEDSAGTNSAGADSGESDSAGAERAEAECAGFDVAHQPCAREMAFELRRSAVRSSSDSRGTAARAWRGSGYFSVLPDNLCGKIASFIVHAKSLVAFRSTCSYLRRVVRVGGALVFLGEDFPHREAAERGITQALLQATAAVTSLYVEAPPASDPFQELAVMTWCLACRDSLEELTLVDGTADASTRRAQALAAAMAAAAAPAALSAAAAPEAARNSTAASANNTTTGDAAAAAGVGLRQRESEGQSHGIENGENTDRDSSDSDGNGGGGGGGGGGRSGAAAAAVTAATLPSPYHTNFYRANEQASAAEEEEEEVEEQPQEWKLEHASRCRNLRQLYLENAVFDCVSTLHLCSPFASLLHLTLAKAVVAGDMVGDLLACCPQLQELTLLLCSGIGPLDLMHAPCAALKRFEVRLSNRAARKDACLELLRLNAPNLEDLELEVDWAPEGRLEHELWGDIRIESGRLRRMSLELAAGFQFHANPDAFSQLTELKLTGDDWSWGTVRAILDLCALSLEELSLTCYIDPLTAASIDTASAFFSSLPSLRFLLLCPSVYYVMIAMLGDTKVIRVRVCHAGEH